MRGSMECRRCRQVVQGQDVCDWVQSLLLLRGEWPPLDCLPTPPPPPKYRPFSRPGRTEESIHMFFFFLDMSHAERNQLNNKNHLPMPSSSPSPA